MTRFWCTTSNKTILLIYFFEGFYILKNWKPRSTYNRLHCRSWDTKTCRDILPLFDIFLRYNIYRDIFLLFATECQGRLHFAPCWLWKKCLDWFPTGMFYNNIHYQDIYQNEDYILYIPSSFDAIFPIGWIICITAFSILCLLKVIWHG